MFLFTSIRWSILLVALAMVGCGSESQGPTYSSEDIKHITLLVDELSEASGRNFNQRFTKTAIPNRTEAGKFRKYAFAVGGLPTINGNEATAKVKLATNLDPNKEIAEKDWQFVKEENGWKIKSAPLP